MVKFVNSCKFYTCFDCVVINHQKGGDCNEHGTIHAISSDFGDHMATQSIALYWSIATNFEDLMCKFKLLSKEHEELKLKF